MNISSENKKILIGMMLFGAWFALIWFKVAGAEDMIQAIKLALYGLGAYHIADRISGANSAPPNVIVNNLPAPMVQGEALLQPPTRQAPAMPEVAASKPEVVVP